MTVTATLRNLLIAAAALGASACSYGSAVDVAPMSARLTRPILPAGDYCEVKGARGAYRVSSREDCAPLVWNAGPRTYTLVDRETPTDSIEAAVAPLGDGLFAAQYETPDALAAPHQINLLIVSGQAFAAVSPLDDKQLDAILARHPKLDFGRDGKRAIVTNGDVEDVKAYLRDAAGEALRIGKAEGEELSVGVLDRQGRPDHPASKAQIRDVEAVKAIAEKLTPKQGAPISVE